MRAKFHVKALTVISAIWVGIACSSPTNKNTPTNHRAPLEFELATSLFPRGSFQKDIIQLLGAPEMKSSLSNRPGSEAWLYLEGKPASTRLSLIFEASSGELTSANWFPNDNEPESNLAHLLEHYRNHSFEKRKPKWINSHAAPDELFFVDDRAGLKIVYLETPKRVESIIWTRPSRPPIANK